MLKINYVFREMKQADILKAYCSLFGGQSRAVTSYFCRKIVSQGAETQRIAHPDVPELHRTWEYL